MFPGVMACSPWDTHVFCRDRILSPFIVLPPCLERLVWPLRVVASLPHIKDTSVNTNVFLGYRHPLQLGVLSS